MKYLLAAAFLGGSMLLSAEESLKKEVIAHLEVVIKKSAGVPEDAKAEDLYDMMAEEIDFSLTPEQAKQLAGGKTLYTEAQLAALMQQVEDYKEIKSPVHSDSLIDALKDESANARERESAYRLLASLNEQKVKSLRMMNVMRAKQFFLHQFTEGPDAKQDESMMFQGLKGAQKWLFKPKGYGQLRKGDDTSKIIIMAPEPLFGKLVLGCEDGSVHTKTVEEVKDLLDLSQVKLPAAK